MRRVSFESGGITFQVWKEADHDTRLLIVEGGQKAGEPLVLSHDACFILGVALQSIDEHDMEDLPAGENTH